ncbi:MAG: carbohydrate ABC transporter permease [Coprococcus sp.]
MKNKNAHVTGYNRWGYIFLIPFMVTFIIFQLIPLCSTLYNSFFEHFMNGLQEIGPNYVGLDNYKAMFKGGDIWKYFGNTMIMWIMGFIPQILLSLLLASWFSNPSLRLKGKSFFQTVIYLPNLIMASAFAMLFFALFSDVGPINSLMQNLGIFKEPYQFFSHVSSARWLVAALNFLMWFGNTTILLLAGMLGIDSSLYEAAEVDGATSNQVFFKITLPILRPILIYVMITSLIGGLQMFDVPQILTNGTGNPTRTTMTLIMYLNKHLFSKNYGMGGALSVFLFVITGILSFIIFRFNSSKDDK